jgi:hypothetical protein
MRDLILISIILGSIPVALVKPYVGIYLWYWIGFTGHRFTWASCHVPRRDSQRRHDRGQLRATPRALLRSGIGLLLGLTFLFTVNPSSALPTAWERMRKAMKVS